MIKLFNLAQAFRCHKPFMVFFLTIGCPSVTGNCRFGGARYLQPGVNQIDVVLGKSNGLAAYFEAIVIVPESLHDAGRRMPPRSFQAESDQKSTL